MDTTDTAPGLDGEALRKRGNKWMDRIRSSQAREREWIKDAAAAEKAFAADASADAEDGCLYDFNILYSNVETIVPAIYNSTPIPDIRPRRVEATGPEPEQPPEPPKEAQQDPQAMQQVMAQYQQAQQVFQQQMQQFQALKQRDRDAKSYGEMLERAIAIQVDDNRLDAEIEGSAQDAFLAGRGIVRLRFEAEGDALANQRITFEAVSWRDYCEGPAKRWVDVPWVAFRQIISRETFDRLKDDEMMAAQDVGTDSVPPLGDGMGDSDDDDIKVWEIWDKLSSKVLFVREDDGKIVKEFDDPLDLPGFFPVPQPVQPIGLTGKRIPINPFSVYRKLADELDQATRRINAIMKGLKVRGVAAGNAEKLVALAEAQDNEILIESDLEQLIQTGGLDKAIAWWPVDKAIAVLAQLYQQREEIKASIYEITGISDIVRGASTPSETATAQQIKTQWGSLRIQKMQRLIERQVRDIFAIMAHIISTRFDPQNLQQMTGVQISQGIQELMQSPVDANYRVNVESDSTIRADLTRQKQEMQEFMTGTAGFFSAVGPLVQQAPEAAEPMAEVYAAAARMFRLGKQAEDALDRFVDMAKGAAKNPPPNPEAERNKMEMEAKQLEMQFRQQEAQSKAQLDARKMDLEERRFAVDAAKATADHQMNTLTTQAKLTEAAAQYGLALHKMNSDDEARSMDRQITMKSQRMKTRDGEDGEAEVVTEEEVVIEKIDELGKALMEGLQQLAALIAAPKKVELVRDEKTGRATGAIQRPMVN